MNLTIGAPVIVRHHGWLYRGQIEYISPMSINRVYKVRTAVAGIAQPGCGIIRALSTQLKPWEKPFICKREGQWCLLIPWPDRVFMNFSQTLQEAQEFLKLYYGQFNSDREMM